MNSKLELALYLVAYFAVSAGLGIGMYFALGNLPAEVRVGAGLVVAVGVGLVLYYAIGFGRKR